MGWILSRYSVVMGLSDTESSLPTRSSPDILHVSFYLLPATVNHPGKVSPSLAAAQQLELLDHCPSPFVRPERSNTSAHWCILTRGQASIKKGQVFPHLSKFTQFARDSLSSEGARSQMAVPALTLHPPQALLFPSRGACQSGLILLQVLPNNSLRHHGATWQRTFSVEAATFFFAYL